MNDSIRKPRRKYGEIGKVCFSNKLSELLTENIRNIRDWGEGEIRKKI
jgi:hypothetical protein